MGRGGRDARRLWRSGRSCCLHHLGAVLSLARDISEPCSSVLLPDVGQMMAGPGVMINCWEQGISRML